MSAETRNAEGWGQHVTGRCPVCGSGSLFVAVGGYVTCGYIPCPSPTAVADFLLGETHGLAAEGYSIVRDGQAVHEGQVYDLEEVQFGVDVAWLLRPVSQGIPATKEQQQ